MHLCFHHTPIVQSHAAICSSKIGYLALQPQSPLLSVSLRTPLALSCVQSHLLSEPWTAFWILYRSIQSLWLFDLVRSLILSSRLDCHKTSSWSFYRKIGTVGRLWQSWGEEQSPSFSTCCHRRITRSRDRVGHYLGWRPQSHRAETGTQGLVNCRQPLLDLSLWGSSRKWKLRRKVDSSARSCWRSEWSMHRWSDSS